MIKIMIFTGLILFCNVVSAKESIDYAYWERFYFHVIEIKAKEHDDKFITKTLTKLYSLRYMEINKDFYDGEIMAVISKQWADQGKSRDEFLNLIDKLKLNDGKAKEVWLKIEAKAVDTVVNGIIKYSVENNNKFPKVTTSEGVKNATVQSK